MPLRYNTQSASGNLNTLVAGSVVAGPTIFVGAAYRKANWLSAILALTPATATITISSKWQVSNDGATWIDLLNGPQNAGSVVLVTGTAALSTKAVPAPDSIYGFKYARIALVTGVATGNAGDLYTIGYSFRQLTGVETAN